MTLIVNLEYDGCFMGELAITDAEWRAYPQVIPHAAINRICENFEWDSCDPALIRLCRIS